MSDLALTAHIGPPDPNSGRISDVVATLCLYIGDRGVWTLTLAAEPTTRFFDSTGNVGEELVGLAGVAAGLPAVLPLAEVHLATAAQRTVDLPEAHWSQLREAVDDSPQSVGLVVAAVIPSLVAPVRSATEGLPWSVTICGPVVDARRSQWGAEAALTL
ncbi:hypothetical protein [Pedococcus soli]